MGFGLQKNSPIKLQLNKPNYEALIDRHGQYVRWRQTKLCPCTTDATHNRPDIHCPLCGGSGETYGYQENYTTSFRATAQGGIITLAEEYKDASVLSVWNYQGKQYSFTQHCDTILFDNPSPANGEVVEIKASVPMTKTTDVTLKRVSEGIYKAAMLITPDSDIEGNYGNSPMDIVSIDNIVGVGGEELTASGFRQNLVYVDSEEDELQAIGVKYVTATKFAILSQNLSKEDFNIVQAVKGDAMCTFPYYLNLSEKDIITVLSGTMTMKHILKHSENDTLPQFFIESIASCESMNRKYIYGTDFILTGTNTLQWLDEQPEYGVSLSFVFNCFPTYRVLNELPMLRTSENQKLPRKAAIQLFTGFMENRRLEWQ